MGSRREPNPIDVHVGGRVKLRRMMARISQTELGEAIGGITFQQVQKYEKGTNRVSASRLAEIAKVFGEPISYFFEGTEGLPGSAPDATATTVDLAVTRDAIAMNRAFARIADPRVRHSLIEIATAAVAA